MHIGNKIVPYHDEMLYINKQSYTSRCQRPTLLVCVVLNVLKLSFRVALRTILTFLVNLCFRTSLRIPYQAPIQKERSNSINSVYNNAHPEAIQYSLKEQVLVYLFCKSAMSFCLFYSLSISGHVSYLLYR